MSSTQLFCLSSTPTGHCAATALHEAVLIPGVFDPPLKSDCSLGNVAACDILLENFAAACPECMLDLSTAFREYQDCIASGKSRQECLPVDLFGVEAFVESIPSSTLTDIWMNTGARYAWERSRKQGLTDLPVPVMLSYNRCEVLSALLALMRIDRRRIISVENVENLGSILTVSLNATLVEDGIKFLPDTEPPCWTPPSDGSGEGPAGSEESEPRLVGSEPMATAAEPFLGSVSACFFRVAEEKIKTGKTTASKYTKLAVEQREFKDDIPMERWMWPNFLKASSNEERLKSLVRYLKLAGTIAVTEVTRERYSDLVNMIREVCIGGRTGDTVDVSIGCLSGVMSQKATMTPRLFRKLLDGLLGLGKHGAAAVMRTFPVLFAMRPESVILFAADQLRPDSSILWPILARIAKTIPQECSPGLVEACEISAESCGAAYGRFLSSFDIADKGGTTLAAAESQAFDDWTVSSSSPKLRKNGKAYSSPPASAAAPRDLSWASLVDASNGYNIWIKNFHLAETLEYLQQKQAFVQDLLSTKVDLSVLGYEASTPILAPALDHPEVSLKLKLWSNLGRQYSHSKVTQLLQGVYEALIIGDALREKAAELWTSEKQSWYESSQICFPKTYEDLGRIVRETGDPSDPTLVKTFRSKLALEGLFIREDPRLKREHGKEGFKKTVCDYLNETLRTDLTWRPEVPVSAMKGNPNCGLCGVTVKRSGDKSCAVTPCKHIFHYRCFSLKLAETAAPICPTCRIGIP